jgi:DNA-binding CsgD family transcriptional regulator
MPASNVAQTLKPREREVLRLLAAGLGQKQIARHLGTSPRTVLHQVAAARRRLGAPTTIAAVALAIRDGLLD